jgi:hypothetical protein
MPDCVSSPLTLVMTIKSESDYQGLQTLLGGLQAQSPEKNPIWVALTKLGMVHFARFVFLSNSQLAIITTYDGSFEDYIDAFTNEIGKVFDMLFVHIKDAPPLPVSNNRQQFLDYIKKHDLSCVSFYSAYPDLKVLDILTLQKNQAGS